MRPIRLLQKEYVTISFFLQCKISDFVLRNHTNGFFIFKIKQGIGSSELLMITFRIKRDTLFYTKNYLI